jgi:hypothetical protein
MSYDFRLIRSKENEDTLVTVRSESFLPTTPPDPSKEALKRRVADALIAHNQQLQVYKFDFDEIAKFEKISLDEARLKFRHLELNGPEDERSGIQIKLFDDEASVTVPFWHEGEEAAEIFHEIRTYLNIIRRETGYLIFDPQLGRMIDSSVGIEDSLASYAGAMNGIQKTLRRLGGNFGDA